MFYTFCPECGSGVTVDTEGTCVTCGALAVGKGVTQLVKDIEIINKESDACGAEIERLQEELDARKATTRRARKEVKEAVLRWREEKEG